MGGLGCAGVSGLDGWSRRVLCACCCGFRLRLDRLRCDSRGRRGRCGCRLSRRCRCRCSGVDLYQHLKVQVVQIAECLLDIFQIMLFDPIFNKGIVRGEHDETRACCLDLNTREERIDLRCVNGGIRLQLSHQVCPRLFDIHKVLRSSIPLAWDAPSVVYKDRATCVPRGVSVLFLFTFSTRPASSIFEKAV